MAPQFDESLERDALAGNAQAQYDMGMAYETAAKTGWGNDENWDEAAHWFEMAAGQGDPRAQYRVAGYYFSRLNDYEKAFSSYRSAAEQNLADAQYSLGMHYAQAWGTEQDLVLAYKWIALANDGGIKGGSLADVDWLVWKAGLNAEQVAEGKRLVAEHLATYGQSISIRTMKAR